MYMYMYIYMLDCSLVVTKGCHFIQEIQYIRTCTCSSTHLSIPGHSADVLQWVELIAGAHGGRRVRQVPDEYFRVTGPRGQEVGLERVHIQGSYSTSVLGGLGN